MKIFLGSDHAGVELKALLLKDLRRRGCLVEDLGTMTTDPVDYPDVAARVAGAVSRQPSSRGVLICGTGNGMAITANKFPRVRAALAWSAAIARLAAQHNKANILCLPGRFLSPTALRACVKAWLATPFEGGRHRRRVAKIARFDPATPRS